MKINKFNESKQGKINAFGFEFSIGDDDKVVIGIIPFLSEPEYEEEDRSDMEDTIIDLCQEQDLESEYGVHDVSGGQTVKVNGQKYECIFGFDTYEVPKDKISELMIIWRNNFEKLGFKTDTIVYKEINE